LSQGVQNIIWLTLPSFNLEKIKTILVIGLLLFLLLLNRGEANAMEAQITSIEGEPWEKSVIEGRALLGTHAEPPEMVAYGPVAPKRPKTHYPLVATLLVLMVVAVGAICCCCYQWEGQMRVQARPRSTGHSEMTEGTPRSSPNSRQSSGEFCGTNSRVRTAFPQF